MSVKVASEWLNACSGCEIAIVDMGERLLKALERMEFVHIPVLMDHKYFGQTGEGRTLRLPAADVGIVSGGVRNAEHLEVAEEMRKQCRTLIALGTCATHGGIPALCNSYTSEQIQARTYHTETTDPPEALPSDGIPALGESCQALDEVVKVDVYLPGCAPHPDQVYGALMALLEGQPPPLREKSVCDTCPTRREGKGDLARLQRFLKAPAYGAPDEPLDEMRCLLEQGILCMGPVTRAGCGGDAILPRCLTARVPCRGCYGPVTANGNQRMDMLGALASNGIDLKSLPESTSLLRFSGAHGRLRPPFVQK
ncbi:MAG: methyl viologen-reducing hydrogenase [Desulfosarcinaceae bacterium]|jgi:F420-non-reducing hydrogenase small subunit